MCPEEIFSDDFEDKITPWSLRPSFEWEESGLAGMNIKHLNIRFNMFNKSEYSREFSILIFDSYRADYNAIS